MTSEILSIFPYDCRFLKCALIRITNAQLVTSLLPSCFYPSLNVLVLPVHGTNSLLYVPMCRLTQRTSRINELTSMTGQFIVGMMNARLRTHWYVVVTMLPGGNIFPVVGVDDLYGANVTIREYYLTSSARGSFVDLQNSLPTGTLVAFFIYIHNFNISLLDAQSRYIRLQIWRVNDIRSKTYRLVYQQRLNVNVTGALYVVNYLFIFN